jgi:hypothetical protein
MSYIRRLKFSKCVYIRDGEFFFSLPSDKFWSETVTDNSQCQPPALLRQRQLERNEISTAVLENLWLFVVLRTTQTVLIWLEIRLLKLSPILAYFFRSKKSTIKATLRVLVSLCNYTSKCLGWIHKYAKE